MKTDELNALAGAYALDALDADERAVFEEHLETCTDCADEVASWREAAAELSHVTAVEPPPELRSAVLAGITQVRPLPPILDNVVPLRRLRSTRLTWQLVAAACALIAIVSTSWGLVERSHNGASAQASALSSVVSAPDASTTIGNIGGSSQVTMFYSKSEGKMVLVAHNVTPLAADKTYQAWTITASGSATSAGLFRPNAEGAVTFSASASLAGAALVGVTVEPAGGSPKPTSTPVGSGLRI